MAKIRLLVKGRRLEAEGIDNIVDLDSAILNTFLGLLSRGVCTSVCTLQLAL